MKGELQEKDKKIKLKQEEQNKKSDEIYEKRKESAKLKKDNIRIFEQVEISEKEIIENYEKADKELKKAEPLLELAKKSVEVIDKKKKELRILTGYANPHENIKTVLCAVATLLKFAYETKYNRISDPDWMEVKKLMQKDFIGSIRSIGESLKKENPSEYDRISETCKKYIMDKYFEIDESQEDEEG